MKFDTRWFDATAHLAGGVQPIFLLEREEKHTDAAWAGQTQVGRHGAYWVPDGDLLAGAAQWACTRSGVMVRVPVVAYAVPRALAALFGVGIQVGLAALADLRNHTADVPTAVTLVLAHQVTDLAPLEDAFRVYVGVAVRTK